MIPVPVLVLMALVGAFMYAVLGMIGVTLFAKWRGWRYDKNRMRWDYPRNTTYSHSQWDEVDGFLVAMCAIVWPIIAAGFGPYILLRTVWRWMLRLEGYIATVGDES